MSAPAVDRFFSEERCANGEQRRFSLSQNIGLEKFQVGTIALLDRETDDINKLGQREKTALKIKMGEFLSEALKREDIKKCVAESGGRFRFSLSKKRGFVLYVGERQFNLFEYGSFVYKRIQLNTRPWEIFKNIFTLPNFSANQSFLAAAREIRCYATKTGLGKNISLRRDESVARISRIFHETVALIKMEGEKISEGHLVKHNGKFMNFSNICGLGANAFSASPATLVVAILDFFRAIGYALYRSVEFYKAYGSLNGEKIKKYTPFEISYQFVGFIYAVGIFIIGLLLAIEHLVIKVVATMFSVLAIFWSLWNILNFGSQEARISKLREKLNAILENPDLSEKQRLKGYLAHLLEIMQIQPDELEEIKKTVLAKGKDYKKQLQAENRLSREEIERKYAEYIEKKINHAVKQEIRFRIEKLIMMGDGFSSDIEEMIRGLDANSPEAVKKAKAFIAKVDQTSYQNELINNAYKWLGLICLLGTVLFALAGPAGWAVLTGCIFWSIICLLYIVIDCQWSSNVVASLFYNKYREERAYGILGLQRRTQIECMAQITGWQWLKKRALPARVEGVAREAIA